MTAAPAGTAQSSADAALSAARDAEAEKYKAGVTSQKTIAVDGNPGIEFEFEGRSVHGITRIYLAGTSLYQITSTSKGTAPLLPETGRIFDSFHPVNP